MSNNTNAPITSEHLLTTLGDYRTCILHYIEAEATWQKEAARLRWLVENKRRKALGESQATLKKEIAQVDATGTWRHRTVETWLEAKRDRILKAELTVRRDLPKRVEAARSAYLGTIQRERLRRDREATAQKTAIQAQTQQALTQLTPHQDAINAQIKIAQSLLLAVPTLRPALTASAPLPPEPTTTGLATQLQTTTTALEALRSSPAVRVLRLLPALLLIPLLLIAAAALHFTGHSPSLALIAAALLAVLHLALTASVGPTIAAARTALATLRAYYPALQILIQEKETATLQELEKTNQAFHAESSEQWKHVDHIGTTAAQTLHDRLALRLPRISDRLERLAERVRRDSEENHGHTANSAEGKAQQRARAIDATHATESHALEEKLTHQWQDFITRWQAASHTIWHTLQHHTRAASVASRPWDPAYLQAWQPATTFQPITPIATLHLDIHAHTGATFADPTALPLPGPPDFKLPLILTIPQRPSLLLQTHEPATTSATATFSQIILRLLAQNPPGRLAFTIIDPVGLGAGFAGLMHLADYEDSLINRRIWTQRDHIDERLHDLTQHIEKVIQMYLRNDYPDITTYNAHAGSIAEKYHYLVIADFPTGFTETSLKRLQSIAASGPRCGVFLLLHWDQRTELPADLIPDDLRRHTLTLEKDPTTGAYTLPSHPHPAGLTLTPHPAPDPTLALDLIHRIGKASIDSSRVQVPFSQITPPHLWQSPTTDELRVPIGRTGATKHQLLNIGKGTRQHALIAGKTGSGKSTLFHVIITNLALHSSPDHVEFYLIDFKKGVEFKCYATQRLPHARVVAIESDREFALSVLQRIDEELKRRGDIFRKLSVQDLPGYARSGAPEPMPRTLLLIDEFQEFFVEDDTIAQSASLLLDRIVRQGRAFGIHVILGSQTLGGAYSLAKATLGQMAIRIALQCNEADAYLIMDDGNAAPRLLTRPGEGIYNDASGALEGNSPFQVVWMTDQERDQWLEKITTQAAQTGRTYDGPVVFEGNAPADISENHILARHLTTPPAQPPTAGRIWLGAPNSIKGPTEAIFHRQSGHHLLIVGQREEATIAIITLGLRALAAQYPAGTAQFYLLHSAPPDTPDAIAIAHLSTAMPHGFTEARPPQLPETLAALHAEFRNRSQTGADTAPPIYLFIHGLHRFKKLRKEDDFSFSSEEGTDPATQFMDLITEGSAHGIHIIASTDTLNNLQRALPRKALSEFEMRIIFQMSPNDSSALIDSPRASTLGLHRAIFFNEQTGTDETFRPYSPPTSLWWKNF